MKIKKRMNSMTRWICGGALGLALVGCSPDDDKPPAINITGAWVTTTWISAYVPGPDVSVRWSLTQSGSVIAGNFVDNLSKSGSISGSINDYKVFLTFQYAYDQSRRLDYEATVGTNVMNGAFRGAGEVKLGNANRVLTQ